MAWIETIEVEEATGDLAAAYARLMDSRGRISNIMSAQSLDPRAMEAVEATAEEREGYNY